MNRFSTLNALTGWLVFLIAAVVYLATMESTASFWDCGEFITSGFKLQVGHPPGAPFFMLMARFATLFAGADVTRVPVMVNALSGLASAFTILFLFWTITHLAKKLVAGTNELTTDNIIAILAAGVVGALAFTFSDSFWFSAVEGEVYASSSLFTALVFWAILKWENEDGSPYANRWLILIAYLMGLSIGVHLLNLLAIPAIVLVYYFRHFTYTPAGLVKALVIAAVILGTVMYGVIPGSVKMAAYFDLFFVNYFGLPIWSGVLIFLILVFGALIYGTYYSVKRNKVVLNMVFLSLFVILLGYASYATIAIRSMANPPMDQNNPSHPFALLSFLNREQYGDRPLVKGQYFNAQPESVKDGSPIYTPIDGKYVQTNKRVKYIYPDQYITLFPRMWSSDQNHVNAYMTWAGIDEKDIYEPVRNADGSTARDQEGNIRYDHSKPKRTPTFLQNLRYFFRYQINHMYFRYFMWNFSGRQNDIQSQYKSEINKGNWISGIKFLDQMRLGNQDALPQSMLQNKARNRYFLLPFLLGLVGLYWQYKKHRHDFWVTMTLFIMTGLAIVVYLNQNPIQPRERDYSYAGSFYAYAIWIGLGVLAVAEALKRALPSRLAVAASGLITLIAVPGIMARENWDDHDRSGRYMARDFAYNYLNTCAPNAIIFTNGDNDTFPLWYAQEVEGIRTDVRVVNLSYLSADWYIEQMQRKAYESAPVPFSLTPDKYIQGTRDIVYLMDMLQGYTDLKQAIDFVADDNPATKRLPNYAEQIDFIPNRRFSIPVDKQKVLENGTVSQRLADEIVDKVTFGLESRYVLKNSLMVLDLLAHNNWERPIYFAITVSNENFLNLQDYFQTHGLAYRVVPVRTNSSYYNLGGIDTDIVYENLVHKFKWGGINDSHTYLDENVVRMASNIRNTFTRLAEALISEGRIDSARTVLDKCLEVIPNEKIQYNIFNLNVVEGYFLTGDTVKALEVADILEANAADELNYLISLDRTRQDYLDYEKRLNLHILNELSNIYGNYGQEEKKKALGVKFQEYLMALNLAN